ncbi:MAG: hypothetical protein IKN77_09005 [Paludibacteraceae bacterium]|nr:hypothetical protein [Paludibacteraceae bacterium]
MEDLIKISIVAYIVYFVLLVIAFGIIRFVLTKVLRKNVSKKKMGIWFLIILVFPFAFLRSCKSCADKNNERIYRERTQESYVRNFLVENEASSLSLPKFKVNSYEGVHTDRNDWGDQWVIEFEEPIDSTRLIEIDPSGTAKTKDRVLFFPIVHGYSETIDSDFMDEDYHEKRDAEKAAIKEGEEPDYKYDYRYFKLELLPDCKTAILLYMYHGTVKESRGSGGSWHHHDD